MTAQPYSSPPSYAAVTTMPVSGKALPSPSATNNGTSNNNMNNSSNNGKNSFESQLEELSQPTPQSMTLIATLQLLSPIDTNADVFLLTRSYLQNWLVWAYHQKVSKTESSRVEAAVRLAAERMELSLPRLNMEYKDPGPIDSSLLSIEGHPLLLRPNVEVTDGSNSRELPYSIRQVKSLPDKEQKQDSAEGDDLDIKDDKILCCAVPQSFYETLRSVHGVVCDDGLSISFQPFQRESEAILHHHFHVSPTPSNGHGSAMNGSSSLRLRPIEFRRRVIMKPAPVIFLKSLDNDPTSPMSKLLKEEQKLSQPKMVPTVELHPIKLKYSVIDGKNQNPIQGFVLVSRRTNICDALHALLNIAAPKTASSCKRLWSKRVNGTKSGDGYEVIDIGAIDGNLLKKDKMDAPSEMLTGEWIASYGNVENVKEIDLLVESCRPKEKWPREELELCNRIQVGDFVDAQDATGKWYEALVRDVTDDTVTVHYFGWASKWNSTIRRRKECDVSAVSARINPPAPLWTYSKRWRESITVGKIIEVRDASSRVDRPKWYKGKVVKIGPLRGKIHEMTGGAELELFDDPADPSENKRKRPLLLLGRMRQIMVEVEQERQSNSDALNIASIGAEEDDNLSVDTLGPEPPFLRWVSLYGEEICEAGTHMKIDQEGDQAVATLQYEYDTNRKPVEIMKSWNNIYGQGFMKESLLGIPPAPGAVGMHNLGNSCFLNSIIQCLNQMEPITQYFVSGEYMNDLNRKNPLGSGGRVATAYASLLKEIWSGKFSALAPRMLKQTVASFAPQFNNSYQHDSQEFCQFLMDGLHEDCNRVKDKPYVEDLEGFGMEDAKAAIETWRKHLLRHDSIIVDYCQGMHRSHLTCPSCGRESIKFDVFSTISLPLAFDKNQTVTNLEDCIEKFMEGEQLDDMNAWYCPGCKKHVCALKMIALWSVPDILIFQLKRFTFDHCAVSNNVVRSKIDDTVKFPIEGLDLRKHVLGSIDEDAPPVYRLIGVSEHTGSTANSGHYTATVRNCRDGRWYRYNDAHVGETTGDAAVTGGAYLLFYKRAMGTARWAGMENVMKERNVNPYGGPETDQDGFTVVKGKKK